MKLSIVTDEARVNDPKLFVKLFEDALDSMLHDYHRQVPVVQVDMSQMQEELSKKQS